MKAVLISIRPRWCELIRAGVKTIEIRKNRPKLETPFRCYIYQSKGRPRLIDIIKDGDDCYGETYHGKPIFVKAPEYGYGCTASVQKVIGTFVCDRIDRYIRIGMEPVYHYRTGTLGEPDYNAIQLTEQGLLDYGGGVLYGWHISDLTIYARPRLLSDFCAPPETYCERGLCGGCPYDEVMGLDGDCAYDCEWKRPILKAPQSWCYVEENDDTERKDRRAAPRSDKQCF